VRILVGAGIHDAQQLRRMTSEQLLSKVESYIRTNEGRAILVSGDDFELARVANWIRSARESREFHRESERQQALRRSKEARRVASDRLSVFGRREREGERRFQPRDGRTSAARTASSRTTSSSRSRSESTTSRTSRGKDAARLSSNGNDEKASGSTKLRFHLDRDSDVEAAPSIGPKMAEHLAKIRIITVGDLLDHDADLIADQLDHKRVNTDTVKLWQRQAEWVCRVPELRGHDAQLLVASGYDTVEDLQGVDAQEVFEAVQEIVDTKEGRRILRGGTEPDLAEVNDWLEWSKQSRQLRAA
jgi:nucleotidyltransferase/DNA polymerase involved in DNA repair